MTRDRLLTVFRMSMLILLLAVGSSINMLALAQEEGFFPDRDTFIYVRPQEVVTLDPALVTESQSGFIVRNVYSRLIDTAYDGSEVYPDLAESWEVSNDGLVYTFHLRPGVTFHDGTPLKASDAVYSVDRFLSLAEGTSSTYLPYIDVGSTVALDDSTVQITLKEPFPAFLQVMGYPEGPAVLSQAWVEAHATEEDPWAIEFAGTNAMGTGPYQFAEWVPNEFVRMVRYDNYYGGPPAIPEVISMLNLDDTSTRLMLEKGEIDAIQHLPHDIVRAMAEDPNVTVKPVPGERIIWAFNLLVPPFDDVRVRQAIAAAIDYDAVMELVGDSGTPLNSPVLSYMKYYNADLPYPKQDLELVSSLLAQAGYPDGLEIDLVYVDWGLLKQLAVVLQAGLAEANVTANLVEMPFGPFLDGVSNDEIGFFSWATTPNYPLALAVMDRFTSKNIGLGLAGNYVNFSNEELDDIVEQIHTTTDEAELEQLYHRGQEILMENMVWVLLYEEQAFQVTGAWVEGYDTGPYNYLDMRDVSFKGGQQD